MKKMQRFRGVIEKIDEETIIITDRKSGEEKYFHRSDFDNPSTGDEIDLLISETVNSDGYSRIIMNKKKPKNKAFKMHNFSTLVRHMLKTKDRLILTKQEMGEENDTSRIDEQIEYLERGISLFS